MPPRLGCSRTTNSARLIDSVGRSALSSDVLKCLVEMLNMVAHSWPSVKQTSRLGATNFNSTTDPSKALFWLFETEKILEEGMQCLDEDKVRIAGFILGGDAHKWWVMKRDIKLHT